MKHLVWVLAMLLVVADGTAGETGPSSFRCKNDLVQIGDSKASALQKCGVPVARDMRDSQRARRSARWHQPTGSSLCELLIGASLRRAAV